MQRTFITFCDIYQQITNKYFIATRDHIRQNDNCKGKSCRNAERTPMAGMSDGCVMVGMSDGCV